MSARALLEPPDFVAPFARWTAYEAVRFGIDMPDHIPMTTQERAYTSPIWYTP